MSQNNLKIKVDNTKEVIITKSILLPTVLAVIAEKGIRFNELELCYLGGIRQTELVTILLFYLEKSFGWYECDRRQEEKDLINKFTNEVYHVNRWVVTIRKHGAIRQ